MKIKQESCADAARRHVNAGWSGQVAVQLAMVAAPFAAAGLDDRAAVDRAVSLIRAADDHITRAELASLKANPNRLRDLAGVQELLGLKTERRVRQLFERTSEPGEFERVWRAALAGHRVFTPEATEAMQRAKSSALSERNRKVSAVRAVKENRSAE
jgi:hypothetical protein